MRFPRARILIFAKAPQPGRVKTRLIPRLGADGACRLYAGLLERRVRELPSMLDYTTHAEGGSLYNTPPVFCVYVLGRVVRWLVEQGGLGIIDHSSRDHGILRVPRGAQPDDDAAAHAPRRTSGGAPHTRLA